MPAMRPIGYWLKLLDELIETGRAARQGSGVCQTCGGPLARTLAPFGIDRRHWQILNVVEMAPRTNSQVAAELAPFLESPNEANGILHELVEAGWVLSNSGTFGLTESGIDRLQAARADIGAARQRISEGLSRQSYDTTISTLEAMCRNLGWTDDA